MHLDGLPVGCKVLVPVFKEVFGGWFFLGFTKCCQEWGFGGMQWRGGVGLVLFLLKGGWSTKLGRC